MDGTFDDLRKALDESYTWPVLYMFKFIAPKNKIDQVKSLFPKNEVVQRESKGGNYLSLTCKILVNSSEDVIRVYQQASKIKGVISL